MLLCVGCPGGDHLLGALSDGSGDGSAGDDATGTSGAATDTDGASETGDAADPFAGAEAIKPWAEGLGAANSGVWSATRNRLLVTDPIADAILEVRPMSFAALFTPAGGPTALVERGDALIVAESATGRIVQRDADATTVLVDGLVHPVALASDDHVWIVDAVTDDSTSILRLVSDGTWSVALAELGPVRGLALAADANALLAVDRDGGVSRLAISATGTFSGAEPLATVADATPAVCVDDRDDVLVGSGTSLIALAPDGAVVGTLDVGEIVRDCSFGGYDRRTLLLTTSTAILSVRLAVAGPP